MQYDFNRPIDRWDNYAVKYDEMEQKYGRRDLLPMWIADMDLCTAQPILDAIDARNRQAIFGYTSRPDSYFEAVCQWQEKRNGWRPDPKKCVFSLGVVPTLCTCVREFSQPGDEVLFLTPVYGEFFDSVENWGRKCLTVPLVEKDNVYTLDFEAFEKALQRRPPLFILCHPHNPVGKVWTEEELRRMGELCVQYGTLIISDEIHSDLMLFGHKHIPIASLGGKIGENTITCTSATKTFNLAGLVGSYHIIYNPWLRERVEKESSLCCYNEMNVLSMHALTAAYSPEGAEWLDELRQVLSGNVDFACKFIAERFQGVRVSRPQGTYMLFLDCTDWCAAHGKTIGELERLGWDVGVAWQDGRMFHGPCHLRINLALPLSRVQEAFDRLNKYVFNA